MPSTTIRIKVPDHSFSSILLLVSPNTTVKQIKAEVLDQLYDMPKKGNGTFYTQSKKYRHYLVARNKHDDAVTVFMNGWTVGQIFEAGTLDLELIRDPAVSYSD